MTAGGSAEGSVVATITEWGRGDPLLLVHGGPGLSDYMWMLDGETSGWRAVSYQQRGLAPSRLEGPFGVDDHVADLLEVLDAMRLERVTLLGHSWGGHLALQAALAAPSRFAALVLVDPLGDLSGDAPLGGEIDERIPEDQRPRLAELLGAVRAAAEAGDPAAADAAGLELLRLRWPSYFATRQQAVAMPESLRLSLVANAEGFESVLPSLRDGSFLTRLARLPLPVEVVLGGASPFPTSQGRALAAAIPGGELTVVEGAGHLPWVEEPGCVSEALQRAFARTG